MNHYIYQPKGKHAKSSGSMVRVSPKHSLTLCRAVSGLLYPKAAALLEGMVTGQRTLNGRTYDKAVGQLLSHLQQAGKNAEFQGLDPATLTVHASAHKAFAFMRPRRTSFRRRQIKSVNLQVVLRPA